MASVKFEQKSKEWQLFMDFWKLCQDFWKAEDEDSYWEKLFQAADQFANKYPDTVFAKRLAMAFLEYENVDYHKTYARYEGGKDYPELMYVSLMASDIKSLGRISGRDYQDLVRMVKDSAMGK